MGEGQKVRGYATQAERWAKQQRLQHLGAQLAETEKTIGSGRVSVVGGGRRLARVRHHLDDADLTVDQWDARWGSARLFLSADGETGKRLGNETIRVHPDTGTADLVLPAPLAGLSNTPGRARTYQLDATAVFSPSMR